VYDRSFVTGASTPNMHEFAALERQGDGNDGLGGAVDFVKQLPWQAFR